MSWPIGRGNPKTRYEVHSGAGVSANGVRLTDADGWMKIDVAVRVGMPLVDVSVRLRCVSESERAPFFYIDDVLINGRRYRSVYAAIVDGHELLAVRLAECVHAEMTRRLGRPEPGSHSRLAAVNPRSAVGVASR